MENQYKKSSLMGRIAKGIGIGAGIAVLAGVTTFGIGVANRIQEQKDYDKIRQTPYAERTLSEQVTYERGTIWGQNNPSYFDKYTVYLEQHPELENKKIKELQEEGKEKEMDKAYSSALKEYRKRVHGIE